MRSSAVVDPVAVDVVAIPQPKAPGQLKGIFREGNSQMDKVSLTALARQHLASAHNATSGRSAHTVYGGHQHTLRQTLLALTAGTRLADHDSPGEATLQVLQGRVRLTTPDTSWDGTPGDHLVIPPTRHGLDAIEDSVVLLTVAKSINRE